MNASLLQTDSLTEQVQSLLTAIDRLRAEVDELRQENGHLRQQVRELRCDVGYWKNLHARATQRNVELQAELDQAKAEIRQLKAERFGKRSEKQSAVDRSNQLVDPENPTGPKNNAVSNPDGRLPSDETIPICRSARKFHFPDDVQGVLMVDRYSGYKAMRQVKDGTLVLAFCWAHVRRDFVRIGKGYPELKTWDLPWLSRIRELYRLNRERLRHALGTPEFVAADGLLREHVDSMAAQRDTELADAKLREPCRKALVSLDEHWNGLTLFVDDPRIPLDNNYGERLIRGPAVGRKNYYGSGAEWSGRLAMMMFSIFATLTGH